VTQLFWHLPLLFGGVQKTDFKFPLAQFQAVETDRAGFWELVLVANNSLQEDKRKVKTLLNSTFGLLWPEFEAELESTSNSIQEDPKVSYQGAALHIPENELNLSLKLANKSYEIEDALHNLAGVLCMQ
jgi:hypothetical protein